MIAFQHTAWLSLALESNAYGGLTQIHPSADMIQSSV
jgi:hypothetical protein